MVKKNFILNIDNFGISSEYNQAVLEGYNNGFITSTHLCVNFKYYDDAINNILPDCPNLGIGLLLNITTGKSLTNCSIITDSNGEFNKNFLYLLMNRKRKDLLDEIEQEFRAQIEKIQSNTMITSIASFAHIHVIPEIFEIVCKLAVEYGISFVRTHFEELYFVKRSEKHINFRYLTNLVQLFAFQHFTSKNRLLIDKYKLKTNDFILGIAYNSMMDSETIEQGLQILEEDCIVEVVIHPKKYNNSTKNGHTREFGITQNLKLKDSILRLGFEINNYKNIQ